MDANAEIASCWEQVVSANVKEAECQCQDMMEERGSCYCLRLGYVNTLENRGTLCVLLV